MLSHLASLKLTMRDKIVSWLQPQSEKHSKQIRPDCCPIMLNIWDWTLFNKLINDFI